MCRKHHVSSLAKRIFFLIALLSAFLLAVLIGTDFSIVPTPAEEEVTIIDAIPYDDTVLSEIAAEYAAQFKAVEEALYDQNTPEYASIYSEIVYQYITITKCLELELRYNFPTHLPVNEFSTESIDDFVGVQFESKRSEMIDKIIENQGPLSSDELYCLNCLLYPALQLELSMQNGLEIPDPLEPEIQSHLDGLVKETIRQLSIQGNLSEESVSIYREVLYSQAKLYIYQQHGID